MTKPSTIPEWATNGGTTLDPGATMRQTGFTPGKKLPAKWLNWLFAQQSGWFTYLRDLHLEPEYLNKLYAWTGVHRFASNVQLTGASNEVTYTNASGVATPRQRTFVVPLSAFVPETTALDQWNQPPVWFLRFTPEDDLLAGWVHNPANVDRPLSADIRLPFGTRLVQVRARVHGKRTLVSDVPINGDITMGVGVALLSGGYDVSTTDFSHSFTADTVGVSDLVCNAATDIPALYDNGLNSQNANLFLRFTSSGLVALNNVTVTVLDPGLRNF